MITRSLLFVAALALAGCSMPILQDQKTGRMQSINDAVAELSDAFPKSVSETVNTVRIDEDGLIESVEMKDTRWLRSFRLAGVKEKGFCQAVVYRTNYSANNNYVQLKRYVAGKLVAPDGKNVIDLPSLATMGFDAPNRSNWIDLRELGALTGKSINDGDTKKVASLLTGATRGCMQANEAGRSEGRAPCKGFIGFVCARGDGGKFTAEGSKDGSGRRSVVKHNYGERSYINSYVSVNVSQTLVFSLNTSDNEAVK